MGRWLILRRLRAFKDVGQQFFAAAPFSNSKDLYISSGKRFQDFILGTEFHDLLSHVLAVIVPRLHDFSNRSDYFVLSGLHGVVLRTNCHLRRASWRDNSAF